VIKDLQDSTVYQEPFCPNPRSIISSSGTLFNSIERSMPLLESARRVVEEFEYSADALNKGVLQFMKEMGE